MQRGPTFQLMLLLGKYGSVSAAILTSLSLRGAFSNIVSHHHAAFLVGALCHSGLSAPRDAAPFDAFAVFGDVVRTRPRTATVSFQALGRYDVSCTCVCVCAHHPHQDL